MHCYFLIIKFFDEWAADVILEWLHFNRFLLIALLSLVLTCDFPIALFEALEDQPPFEVDKDDEHHRETTDDRNRDIPVKHMSFFSLNLDPLVI